MRSELLERTWTRAWADLHLPVPAGIRETLIEAYQEPQRHYHSLQHLSECLSLFESVRNTAIHAGEVALALWFHDAIYDVKGKANERQSAQWAAQVLREANADQVIQDRVYRLIMATKHDCVAQDPDQQLIVDIDLAILGASPERFAQYDEQVRVEYSWVPALLYNIKRRSVLKGFLAKDSIYHTPYFNESFEAQARINLSAAV